MRVIAYILLLQIAVNCSTTKNDTVKLSRLNGTWVPVKQEFEGKELPKVVFENQKLIIKDSIYTVIAESLDKGVVKYSGNKMDIYSKEGVNAGKHFTAIFKYENNQFIICYNLMGDRYPEAFESKSKPMLFLSVFQKELKK